MEQRYQKKGMAEGGAVLLLLVAVAIAGRTSKKGTRIAT